MTFDLPNLPELSQAGDTFVLNARASYNFGAAERYQIALWADNITDEEYCTNKTDLRALADSILCVPSDGRVFYGISARIRFD